MAASRARAMSSMTSRSVASCSSSRSESIMSDNRIAFAGVNTRSAVVLMAPPVEGFGSVAGDDDHRPRAVADELGGDAAEQSALQAVAQMRADGEQRVMTGGELEQRERGIVRLERAVRRVQGPCRGQQLRWRVLLPRCWFDDLHDAK